MLERCGMDCLKYAPAEQHGLVNVQTSSVHSGSSPSVSLTVTVNIYVDRRRITKESSLAALQGLVLALQGLESKETDDADREAQ